MPTSLADLERLTDQQLAAALAAATDEREVQRILDELAARDDEDERDRDVDDVERARQERAALVDQYRRAGERRLATVRRMYGEMIAQQWERAEDYCRGHMLNKRAQAAGVNPRELFLGPHALAMNRASGDLLDYWDRVEPRKTFAEFRAETLGQPRLRRAQSARRAASPDDFDVLDAVRRGRVRRGRTRLAFSVDSGTVWTRRMKRLERYGLVKRSRHGQPWRVTPAGLRLLPCRTWVRPALRDSRRPRRDRAWYQLVMSLHEAGLVR